MGAVSVLLEMLSGAAAELMRGRQGLRLLPCQQLKSNESFYAFFT